MGLREQQMQARKDRILDAAEHLIRETGGTDFSVRYLATVSEVAQATPFNLFGSKEGLLYALLSRTLEDIIARGLRFRSTNPLMHVVEAATNAVEMFVRDPAFMRPLYQVLLGVNDPVHRPRFMQRSLGFWRASIARIPDQGLLHGERQREAVVAAMQAQFLGLLEYWIYREIDDAAFHDHAACGMLLCLMAVLEQDGRDALRPLLEESAARLPSLYPQDHAARGNAAPV